MLHEYLSDLKRSDGAAAGIDVDGSGHWRHGALRADAAFAQAAGFDGVWVYDHLAGSVHRAPHVLECWTVLTAIAATVPRLRVGSLVLNVANRRPGTLAVAAATLQEVSGGRLLLGLGAGGGQRG